MKDFESRVVEHGDGGWTLWVRQPGGGPFAILEGYPGNLPDGLGVMGRETSAALSLHMEDDKDGSVAEILVDGHEQSAKRIRFPRAYSSAVAELLQRALTPGMMGIDAADLCAVLPARGGLGVLAEYPPPRAQSDMDAVGGNLAIDVSRHGSVSAALVVLPVDATMTPATVDRVAQSVTRNLSEGSDLVLAAPLSITDGEPMKICLFGE
ncbi:hypothetical protein [Thioalkalivibrio sp. AKL12]|uniref:hypothetical protein n=1 Tax=Thioalkalivibrio sp. AKL12 TaxID=1158159 RepID=UPI0003674E59|nr:hypothetical protein [Thioalkalivibrio sp. AKL12]